jgi:beta-glucosidase
MGDEVIQLYVRDEYASMPRPVKELRGYQRINLMPNEEQTLTFHLPVDQLAFYDEDLKLCVEAGRMLVMIGSSSEDIRLRGEFEIVGAKKTLVKDRAFVCPVTVK